MYVELEDRGYTAPDDDNDDEHVEHRQEQQTASACCGVAGWALGVLAWWRAKKKASWRLRVALFLLTAVLTVAKVCWAIYLSYVVASYYREIDDLKTQVRTLNGEVAAARSAVVAVQAEARDVGGRVDGIRRDVSGVRETSRAALSNATAAAEAARAASDAAESFTGQLDRGVALMHDTLSGLNASNNNVRVMATLSYTYGTLKSATSMVQLHTVALAMPFDRLVEAAFPDNAYFLRISTSGTWQASEVAPPGSLFYSSLDGSLVPGPSTLPPIVTCGACSAEALPPDTPWTRPLTDVQECSAPADVPLFLLRSDGHFVCRMDRVFVKASCSVGRLTIATATGRYCDGSAYTRAVCASTEPDSPTAPLLGTCWKTRPVANQELPQGASLRTGVIPTTAITLRMSVGALLGSGGGGL